MPIPHGSLASGQLASCAEDMAHYMIVLLNGGRYGDVQVLSGAAINELHRGVADFEAMGQSMGQYGMGWFVDEIGRTKLVWHSGTNPDFAAYMALLPEQKKGVVLLFNASHHWMNPVLSDFGGGVTALLAGAQPSPVPSVGMIPWMLRGLLLIPVLQTVGVVASL
jgi:CubicO group peptidase (beta-lactamase class C family)